MIYIKKIPTSVGKIVVLSPRLAFILKRLPYTPGC